MKNLILPFCILLVSCASSLTNGVLSPSQLNENSKNYDGKSVVVEGYLVVQVGKSSSLWDSKKRYEQDDEIDHCITLRNSDLLLADLNKINNTVVKLSGIYSEDIIGNAINLDLCNSSGLEISGLVE